MRIRSALLLLVASSLPRSAAQDEAPCHDASREPGPQLHQCTIDGVEGQIRKATVDDFSLQSAETFSTKLRCVSKGRDGSLALKASAKIGDSFGVSSEAEDTNSAMVLLGLAGREGCCHEVHTANRLLVRGFMEIGKLPPHSFGRAQIGTPHSIPDLAKPATAFVETFWDDNGNGLRDGFIDRVSILGEVRRTRLGAADPGILIVSGFVETQRTTVADGGGTPEPPVTELLDSSSTPKGAGGHHEPILTKAGQEHSSKFRDESRARVLISFARTTAHSSAPEGAGPEATAALGILVQRLSLLDLEEKLDSSLSHVNDRP